MRRQVKNGMKIGRQNLAAKRCRGLPAAFPFLMGSICLMSPMQRTSRFLQRFQPKIFNEINVSFISQVIFDLILNIGDKHNGIQFIDSDPLHGRLVRIRGFGQLRLGSFLDVAFKNDMQSMVFLDVIIPRLFMRRKLVNESNGVAAHFL